MNQLQSKVSKLFNTVVRCANKSSKQNLISFCLLGLLIGVFGLLAVPPELHATSNSSQVTVEVAAVANIEINIEKAYYHIKDGQVYLKVVAKVKNADKVDLCLNDNLEQSQIVPFLPGWTTLEFDVLIDPSLQNNPLKISLTAKNTTTLEFIEAIILTTNNLKDVSEEAKNLLAPNTGLAQTVAITWPWFGLIFAVIICATWLYRLSTKAGNK